MPLTVERVRSLVAFEYLMVNADVAMSEILDALAHLDLPEAPSAMEDVQVLRHKLRSVLHRLDAPITVAVEQYQTLAEAAA